MSELPMNRLRAEAARHPYPLVFATISGAHLYGFESDDSDFDLRGAHVLPIADVVGLLDAKNTVDFHGPPDGLDTDLVTHDVAKFIRLLLGFLDELIDAKRSGREDTKINVADLAFHESEYARLRAQLESEPVDPRL